MMRGQTQVKFKLICVLPQFFFHENTENRGLIAIPFSTLVNSTSEPRILTYQYNWAGYFIQKSITSIYISSLCLRVIQNIYSLKKQKFHSHFIYKTKNNVRM